MALAIIDTVTRVILRTTTDANPALASTESAIDIVSGIDLAGGPWKLTPQLAKVAATTQDWRDAGLDEAWNALERQRKFTELLIQLDVCLGDLTLPRAITTLCDKLKAHFGG